MSRLAAGETSSRLAERAAAPENGCWVTVAMTTGAALPVGVLPPAERDRYLQRLLTRFKAADFRHLSPDVVSELAATTIRMCLQQGAAERIQYRQPHGAGLPGPVLATPPPGPRIGRNEPCPGASGRGGLNRGREPDALDPRSLDEIGAGFPVVPGAGPAVAGCRGSAEPSLL